MLRGYSVRNALRRGFDPRAATDWVQCRFRFTSNAVLMQSSEPSSSEAGSAERLFGVALLERLPIIIPELPKWQSDYEDAKFERDQSLRRAYPPEFFGESSGQSSQDPSNAALEIEPAPRITEDDKSGNLKSLNRALDRRLYLMVHGRLEWTKDSMSSWHFPQIEHQEGETMRKCAERSLAAVKGPDMRTYTVGNAPCGHSLLSTTTTPSTSTLTKLFYYRIQLLKGDVKLADHRLQDFAWLTKSEVIERLDDSSKELFERMLVG